MSLQSNSKEHPAVEGKDCLSDWTWTSHWI